MSASVRKWKGKHQQKVSAVRISYLNIVLIDTDPLKIKISKLGAINCDNASQLKK